MSEKFNKNLNWIVVGIVVLMLLSMGFLAVKSFDTRINNEIHQDAVKDEGKDAAKDASDKRVDNKARQIIDQIKYQEYQSVILPQIPQYKKQLEAKYHHDFSDLEVTKYVFNHANGPLSGKARDRVENVYLHNIMYTLLHKYNIDGGTILDDSPDLNPAS